MIIGSGSSEGGGWVGVCENAVPWHAVVVVPPLQGRRLRHHPAPQIEPETLHPEIDDELLE